MVTPITLALRYHSKGKSTLVLHYQQVLEMISDAAIKIFNERTKYKTIAFGPA
jgi:hypothetical protein